MAVKHYRRLGDLDCLKNHCKR